MSKKITHKEHRQLLSELYKKQGGKWIYQADAYIKQQEKQEKLLGLYKKLSFAWEERFDYSNGEQRIRDLQKQIKELENEKRE